MQKASAWILLAMSDLEAAIILRNAEKTTQSAYCSQQAAEKALKGFLASHKVPIRKIHDLALLVVECADFDLSFLGLENDAEELKPFSTRSRYPDDYIDLTLEEVDLLISCATRIVHFVASKIQTK